MVRNFDGQPRHAGIFQSLSRLTVSNALFRSTKAAYRLMFCFPHVLLNLYQHYDHVCSTSVGSDPH